ncbi:thioredoxin domain-containing protein [Roseicella aquatilis]|uniref:DsbA family protein n=1 Tax=Roseicella aquatilis TaxID=2527868 RepID=A0A4R4D4J3_9PROT|nr:thioredoxin domain-containing protein [Roseicella aquatilis]TCZ53133.1 DsbA family protein [Roseicella aquatilis]
MRLPRRSLLAAAALAAPFASSAQGTDPRLSERAVGNPKAPVTVMEFYSLTCSHCAAFSRDTFPEVKQRLIDPGIVRMVFRDFPLDQIALAAAAVARSLPAERYEAFTKTLLASQDRWAFTRGDPIVELGKMAALAGMPKAQFEQAVNDEALKRAILADRMAAEREFNIQATPSFSFQGGGKVVNQSGNMSFDRFQQLVQQVKPA